MKMTTTNQRINIKRCCSASSQMETGSSLKTPRSTECFEILIPTPTLITTIMACSTAAATIIIISFIHLIPEAVEWLISTGLVKYLLMMLLLIDSKTDQLPTTTIYP